MKIQLNAAARAAIRHHSDPTRVFRETAEQVGPDLWEVDVDPETLETLNKWRAHLMVDNYSDVILWLAANQKGKPGAN